MEANEGKKTTVATTASEYGYKSKIRMNESYTHNTLAHTHRYVAVVAAAAHIVITF